MLKIQDQVIDFPITVNHYGLLSQSPEIDPQELLGRIQHAVFEVKPIRSSPSPSTPPTITRLFPFSEEVLRVLRNRYVQGTVMVIAILFLVVSSGALMWKLVSDYIDPKGKPVPPIIGCSSGTRELWNASAPIGNLSTQTVPFQQIIVSDNSNYLCFMEEECKAQIRSLQKEMQMNGHMDLEYHFLIGGDGCLYEGLGWDFTGNHTPVCHPEATCLGVLFLGNYRNSALGIPPSDRQMTSLENLLEDGLQRWSQEQKIGLVSDPVLVARCGVTYPFDSPGDQLYFALKRLPMYNRSGHYESNFCVW